MNKPEAQRKVSGLSLEDQWRGWQLVRSSDAYLLLTWVLEDAAARGEVENTSDLENARAELRMRLEEATGALRQFRREHGFPE